MGELDNLIRLLSEGDEKAFRKVYELYHRKVFAVGLYLTNSRAVAEDITQDVFIKIWNKRADLPEVQHFEGWLKVIVKNHSLNIITRAAKERLASKNLSGPAFVLPAAEKQTEKSEEYLLLQKAIDALPPQQQKVYVLSKQQGLKATEIASLLDISIHTVKNHLKAATAAITQFCRKHIELAVLLIFLR